MKLSLWTELAYLFGVIFFLPIFRLQAGSIYTASTKERTCFTITEKGSGLPWSDGMSKLQGRASFWPAGMGILCLAGSAFTFEE